MERSAKRQRIDSVGSPLAHTTPAYGSGGNVLRESSALFDLLPNELVCHVAAASGGFGVVARLALVCQRTAEACSDDRLWRRLYARYFGLPTSMGHIAAGMNWRWLCRMRAQPPVVIPTSDGGAPWKYWGETRDRIAHGYGVAERESITLVTDENRLVADENNAAVLVCDISGNAAMVTPALPVVDNEAYEGNWVDGKPHGRGAWTCSDGSSYIGSFKADLFTGVGTYVYYDGSMYHGCWADNERHGIGVGVSKSKGTYTGQWADGKRHGIGTCIFSNGVCYAGEWQDDKPHGAGKRTPVDGPDDTIGWHYEGELMNGNLHGRGSWAYAGCTYVGSFVNGQFHGVGTYLGSNGVRYEGEWMCDNMHGRGSWMQGGFTYVGTFDNDEFHGGGTAAWLDGARYEGEWQKSVKHGRGIKCYADGSRYEGGWQANMAHGVGTYTWPDGSYYQGEWRDDVPDGAGTYIDPIGVAFLCPWRGGRQHGRGTITYGDGSQCEVTWHKGRQTAAAVVAHASSRATKGVCACQACASKRALSL